MKHHVGLTIDSQLFREIETIRGREKRSTFVEHLIRLGLKTYVKDENSANSSLRKKKSLDCGLTLTKT
jgi:metal-responsive CopG/Arc/MetJ family transcriptional regulator